MPSTPLTRFAELYEARTGPWDTSESWYEQRKRDVALACLPRPTYDTVVEPACGTGELRAGLAPRCTHLAASDGLDMVVRRAQQRVHCYAHVNVGHCRLPEQFPLDPGRTDLVVLSEILYYLDEDDFDAVVDGSVRTLRSEGDLLAVHWRPPPTTPSRTVTPCTTDFGHDPSSTCWSRTRSPSSSSTC